jgi:hypothetical protein
VLSVNAGDSMGKVLYTMHMRLGIALMAIGGVFLLRGLGFFDNVNFSLVWPSLLIIAGFLLIIKPTYTCLSCGRKGWTHGTACKQCVDSAKKGSSFGKDHQESN